MVCKSAWGKITPAAESDENQIPHWHLAHDQLSWTKPVLAKPTNGDPPIELLSYYEYLKQHYPSDDPNKGEQNMAIVIDRVQSFARPGGPGAKFKNQQEKMFKALTLPKGAREELNYPMEIQEKILNGEPLWDEESKKEEEMDEDAEMDESNQPKKLSQEQKYLLEMFGEGKYHLIPSFFRTLITLKKQKREFSVVFRTFGQELDKVVWEFNRFCEGNHPCFSGRNGTPMVKFDGSKGTKDLRIRNFMQKGTSFRLSSQINDAKLLQGTYTRESNDIDRINDLLNSDEYEDFEFHQEPLQ